MKKYSNPLSPGDVIQTHPSRGFWGCAIVLSAIDSTGKFHPMSHIGITTLITRKKYNWKDIDKTQLRLLDFEYGIRVNPGEYYAESRLCIEIHTLRSATGIRIVGKIDPRTIYSKRLTFDVGDGTAGRFPMCGPVDDSLGEEAVLEWRRINDGARFERERSRAREDFEKLDKKLRDEATVARRARKDRKLESNT